MRCVVFIQKRPEPCFRCKSLRSHSFQECQVPSSFAKASPFLHERLDPKSTYAKMQFLCGTSAVQACGCGLKDLFKGLTSDDGPLVSRLKDEVMVLMFHMVASINWGSPFKGSYTAPLKGLGLDRRQA